MEDVSSPTPGLWSIYPFDSNLSISVTRRRDIWSVSPRQQKFVDEYWHASQLSNPALYNGRVFCAHELSPKKIIGFWTNYKNVLTQLAHPQIFAEKALHPLAVVGCLRCADGYVIGQRATKAVYEAGMWQSVPAGAIESRSGDDVVDLEHQLLTELHEEMGLSYDQVAVASPVMGCEHFSSHVIDVIVPMRSALPFEEIGRIWAQNGDHEYGGLTCAKSLEELLNRVNLVPSSRAYARHVLACCDPT